MTFYELEKMCKQRRIKKRVRFILFFILLLIIVYGIWVLNKIKSKEIKSNKEIKTSLNKKSIKKSVVIKKEKNSSKVYLKNNKSMQRSKEMILAPVISLNFSDINVSDSNSQNSSKKVLPAKENVSVPSNKPSKPNTKNIITTEILPSYDECIYQAEDALKSKDYSLALKWAQNANIKNKIRPEAWILTAKILYLTGKKQKALNILKLYLKYNKNKKIEQFLKELENEK